MRASLLSDWRELCDESKLNQKHDLIMLDMLSKGSDRLSWVRSGLPDDDLSGKTARAEAVWSSKKQKPSTGNWPRSYRCQHREESPQKRVEFLRYQKV